MIQIDGSAKESRLDEAAEITAMILSELVELFIFGEKQVRTVKNFLYFFGRWIYLIDAADDFCNDMKFKNFNPFVEIFLKSQNDLSFNFNIRNYIQEALNQTLARIFTFYNFLELRCFKTIVDNVIMQGLLDVQNKVLKKIFYELTIYFSIF